MPTQNNTRRNIPQNILGFLLGNVREVLLGIIGSLIAAYAFLYQSQIVNTIRGELVSNSSMPWIITTLFLFFIVVILWFRRSRVLLPRLRRQEQLLKEQEQLLKEQEQSLEKKDFAKNSLEEALIFDHLTLYTLRKLIEASREQRSIELKSRMQHLLGQATRAKVGDRKIDRASIFLPSEKVLHKQLIEAYYPREKLHPRTAHPFDSLNLSRDDNYLTICVAKDFLPDSVTRARCYIGNNQREQQRGLTAAAYLQKETLVCHMEKQGDDWICRDYSKTYEQFVNRPKPNYQAIVATPIVTIQAVESRKVIGVVCFYSEVVTTFDGEEARKALEVFGSRIGALLSIYWLLAQNEGKQVQSSRNNT